MGLCSLNYPFVILSHICLLGCHWFCWYRISRSLVNLEEESHSVRAKALCRSFLDKPVSVPGFCWLNLWLILLISSVKVCLATALGPFPEHAVWIGPGFSRSSNLVSFSLISVYIFNVVVLLRASRRNSPYFPHFESLLSYVFFPIAWHQFSQVSDTACVCVYIFSRVTWAFSTVHFFLSLYQNYL